MTRPIQTRPDGRSEANKYGVNHIHPPVTSMTVVIDRITGNVRAIGLNDERLDATLGQVHTVPAGVTPAIGKPCPGVELTRNAFTGDPA
jgi:hypothetical protein